MEEIMKKKLLSLMLASALALGVAGGLSACGPEPAPEVPATGITLNRSTMSLDPDSSKGIIPTLEPANATTEIVWTSSDEKIASVKDGLVVGVDSGTATITASVGDYKATCTVTVGDWARYILVGTIQGTNGHVHPEGTIRGDDGVDISGKRWGWDADDATGVTAFKQDATDKHKWTVTLDAEANEEFKFVPAVKQQDGTWIGGGWSGDFGTKKTEDLKENETNTVKGDKGTVTVGPGNGENIKVEADGNYTFTLQMKVGGGVESFSYVRNGDIKGTPPEKEPPIVQTVTPPTEMSTLMLTGTVNGWKPAAVAGNLAFTKGESNTYTLTVVLEKDAQLKIVAAGLNGNNEVQGMGWDGGYNIGGASDITLGTAGGALSLVNAGTSNNMAVGVAGKYTFTITLGADAITGSYTYAAE